MQLQKTQTQTERQPDQRWAAGGGGKLPQDQGVQNVSVGGQAGAVARIAEQNLSALTSHVPYLRTQLTSGFVFPFCCRCPPFPPAGPKCAPAAASQPLTSATCASAAAGCSSTLS